MILSAIAVPNYLESMPRSNASGAARQIFTDMQAAKMKSISENNDYVVTFDSATNRYSVYDDDNNDFASAGADAGELVKSVDVSDHFSGISFGYLAGNDPDGVAIPSAVDLSGTPPRIIFRPTGLANENGAVYLKPTTDSSRADRQRAVTIKVTGRIRLHRNNGAGWE